MQFCPSCCLRGLVTFRSLHADAQRRWFVPALKFELVNGSMLLFKRVRHPDLHGSGVPVPYILTLTSCVTCLREVKIVITARGSCRKSCVNAQLGAVEHASINTEATRYTIVTKPLPVYPVTPHNLSENLRSSLIAHAVGVNLKSDFCRSSHPDVLL